MDILHQLAFVDGYESYLQVSCVRYHVDSLGRNYQICQGKIPITLTIVQKMSTLKIVLSSTQEVSRKLC